MLSLRDVKRQIIEAIKKYNRRIQEINFALGLDEEIVDPNLETFEDPEKRLSYSKDDLIEFEKCIFSILHLFFSLVVSNFN